MCVREIYFAFDRKNKYYNKSRYIYFRWQLHLVFGVSQIRVLSTNASEWPRVNIFISLIRVQSICHQPVWSRLVREWYLHNVCDIALKE